MSELSSSPAIRGSCANIAASVSFVWHSVIKFFRIGQKSPKPTYDTRTDIKSKKNQFLSEGDMGYETLKEKRKKGCATLKVVLTWSNIVFMWQSSAKNCSLYKGAQ